MKTFKNTYFYWLIRSLGIANAMPNNGFGGLSHYLDGLIKQFGGRKIGPDGPVDWNQLGIYAPIGRYGLPATSSTEYEIPINQWPHLLMAVLAIA